MSPTPASPVEDLVRRTLAEVAASLPVAEPPPAELPGPARRGTAGRPGRARLAVLAAAAAAILVGVGVWAVERSGDEDSVGVTSPGPPEAGFLPDDVAPDGEAAWLAGAGDLDTVVALGPGPDDVLVGLEGDDLGRLDHAAQSLAAHVGGSSPDAGGRRPVTYGLGPSGRLRAYVAPPGAEVETLTLVAAAAGDAAAAAGDAPLARTVVDAGDGPGGPWTVTDVDLTWLPGVGRGVGTGYRAAGSAGTAPALTVAALAADLPDDETVRALLADEEPVEADGDPGWAVAHPGAATVVLQVAPGVVGVVTGPGMGIDELVAVAAGTRWPAAVAEPPGRPCGDPPDTAVRDSGEVGLVGDADRPYDVAAWPGVGIPRSPVTCAAVTMAGQRHAVRLVGGGGSGAPVAVARVADTDEDVVLLAAHDPGLVFTGPGVSTQGIEVDGPHDSVLTFVRLEHVRGGEPVPLTVHGAGGAPLLTLQVGVTASGTAGNDTN